MTYFNVTNCQECPAVQAGLQYISEIDTRSSLAGSYAMSEPDDADAERFTSSIRAEMGLRISDEQQEELDMMEDASAISILRKTVSIFLDIQTREKEKTQAKLTRIMTECLGPVTLEGRVTNDPENISYTIVTICNSPLAPEETIERARISRIY